VIEVLERMAEIEILRERVLDQAAEEFKARLRDAEGGS
jgi:hypothetical protein